jgi:hypothetical protein
MYPYYHAARVTTTSTVFDLDAPTVSLIQFRYGMYTVQYVPLEYM